MSDAAETARSGFPSSLEDLKSDRLLAACIPLPAWHVGPRSLIGAPNQFARLRWDLELGIWSFPRSGLFGGVPDSTLGWIVSLPVEDEGWPRKSSFKKIIGNYEEMPLAA